MNDQPVTSRTTEHTSQPPQIVMDSSKQQQYQQVIEAVADSVAIDGGGKNGTASDGDNACAGSTSAAAKKRPKEEVCKKLDPTVPKQRKFSGYYIYMRERREQLRSIFPDKPIREIVSQLAQEWNNMDGSIKQNYLDSAEAEKRKYELEMSASTSTSNTFSNIGEVTNYTSKGSRKGQGGRKNLKKGPEEHQQPDMNIKNTPEQAQQIDQIPTFSGLLRNSGPLMLNNHESSGTTIPIFTTEFLEHSKARDIELRQLRKTVNEVEDQNQGLARNIEDREQEIERVDHELRKQKLQNEMLADNLHRLRLNLVQAFANLPLPGTHESPNLQTIDNYMSEVREMQAENFVHFEPFLNKVKDIISKLDL